MKYPFVLRFLLASMSIVSLGALSSSSEVELQNFLQARARSYYRGHENLRFSVEKGVRGVIIESQEFDHGYGLKLLFMNGLHTGERAWVFYAPKTPSAKLFTSINDFSLSAQTKDIENADSIETSKEELCYQEPRDIAPAKINGMVASIRSLLDRSPAADIPIPIAYQQINPFTKDALGDATYICTGRTLDGDANFNYCSNEEQVHEFTLNNRGSAKVNPVGGAVQRDYTFSAPQQARQDSGLLIYEWGSPDASLPDSAWSMMTEIIFFPRKNLPAIRETDSGNYEVTIQTGEKILFDKKTKEITGGVLQETAPIDMSSNRKTRKFAAFQYTGTGIMVRSDQRGETPRSAVVWGQKKVATIYWKDKVCKVSPADIWQQVDGEGGTGLYATDSDFFAMLKTKCSWDIDPSVWN